jgi:hypothetical protein
LIELIDLIDLIKDDRVVIVHFPSEDIANYFVYYNRVQEIRTSELWKRQADYLGWLARSPQAMLPGCAFVN